MLYTAVAEPGTQQMPKGTYKGRRVIVQRLLAGGCGTVECSCGHQFRAGLSGSAFSPGKQSECCRPSQGCGVRTSELTVRALYGFIHRLLPGPSPESCLVFKELPSWSCVPEAYLYPGRAHGCIVEFRTPRATHFAEGSKEAAGEGSLLAAHRRCGLGLVAGAAGWGHGWMGLMGAEAPNQGHSAASIHT